MNSVLSRIVNRFTSAAATGVRIERAGVARAGVVTASIVKSTVRLCSPLLLMPSLLFAAAKKDPVAAPNFLSGEYLLQVFFSIMVVVALMVAMLWFLKRFNGVGRSTGGHLKVLASVGLGQRERAVLISAGGKQLLVGVAPGSVKTLHVFDEPIVPEQSLAEGQKIRFADVWKQAMGNRDAETGKDATP